MSKTEKMCYKAILIALALILFIVENQIPSPVPLLPGVKLGLANIITVYAMFVLGPADTIQIVLGRIILAAVFAGQAMSFIYSLCGGLLCFLLMWILRKILSEKYIWICSILGAVAHNMGQIFAAIIVTKTIYVISYLPVLMIAGIIAGAFTGIVAQIVVKRLRSFTIKKYNYN